MKKITKGELKEILRKHRLWLDNEPGGEMANLYEANLYGADLRGRKMSGFLLLAPKKENSLALRRLEVVIS